MIWLLFELLFVVSILFALDRLPRPYATTMMAVFVGSNSYLQTILASTVYVGVSPEIAVSPGSVVLFSSSLVAVLLTYLRTDVPHTRALIYGVVGANVTLSILSVVTARQLAGGATNLLAVDPALFQVDLRVFLAGTMVQVLDAVLIVVVYEGLRRRATWLSRGGRVLSVLLIVSYVDALLFSVVAFGGTELFETILRSQVVGKSIAGGFFGLATMGYLVLIRPAARPVVDPLELLTYRKQYEDERRLRIQAIEASAAKSRFLANMSHELRTPLNAILGFSGRLLKGKDGALTKRQETFLKRIHANGMHLLGLINDVLDLSRVEAGKMPFEVGEIDLAELIRELLPELREGLVRGEVELRAKNVDTAAMTQSDARGLRQILTNLVGNALKFTREGEVVVEMVREEGRARCVHVRDTGPGIPEERREAIFAAFTQADDSTTRVYGGTGLGLSITAGICRELGHRVSVESTLGEGSVFTVWLQH